MTPLESLRKQHSERRELSIYEWRDMLTTDEEVVCQELHGSVVFYGKEWIYIPSDQAAAYEFAKTLGIPLDVCTVSGCQFCKKPN